MDNFGYSFDQCERDWHLFDCVPEECRSVQQASLVTSEDTDLSDNSDPILPSRHKRSRRINFHKLHQTPDRRASTEWRTVGRVLGQPVLQDRTLPTLESRFSPENKCQSCPGEDVWSGSEEEFELEIVNQFLMARSQLISSNNSTRSPQIFVISGNQVHSSRSQCPMTSTGEYLRSTPTSISQAQNPVCQSKVANASAGPSTILEMDDYIRDDLHGDHYPNHIERAKDEFIGTGFEHTEVAQESGEGDKAVQEDVSSQKQHSKDSQHPEGHCQSPCGEDLIAQSFVTVSNNSQVLMTREPSNGAESMSENLVAEGKCKTDYSITVPEIYEYFYMDYGEERDQSSLLLHVPSKHTDPDSNQRREINLLTAIKTFVWNYLQTTKKRQPALVPARVTNTTERVKVEAYPDLGSLDGTLVTYSPVDRSLAVMESIVRRGRRGLCRFCTRNDLCLFCFACASWAMKSAASQSDVWKAALFVNLSAISAVRYFRRHVQRERKKLLALQHTT
ncbi:uncharacterized protein perm1a [Narcine bancroftii]|uniref:uncharacterized protein perm1a n=1 Tax=Narcine bancroftii TaxID=1343680 RepID=UPI0038317D64